MEYKTKYRIVDLEVLNRSLTGFTFLSVQPVKKKLFGTVKVNELSFFSTAD